MNMIPKTQRYLRSASLLLAACSRLSLFAGETTVLSDTFSKAMTEEATASIRSETSWYGFTKGGGKLPTIKETDLGGDSISVLDFSAQSQHTLLAAAFPSVDLKRPGDYVQLIVEYSYRYPLKDVVPAFVIGLYDSGGAPLVAGDLRKDLDAAGAAGSNHAGYRLAKVPTEMTGDLRLDLVTGLGEFFPHTQIDAASTGLKLGAREMHQMTLRVTLGEGGNLMFHYGMDGIIQKYSTVAPLKTTVTRFNEVSICPIGRGFETSGNYYIQLGKVKVVRGER
jgi:hypothetical protein